MCRINPLLGNARNTHTANNTEAIFSLVPAWIIAMQCALGTFTLVRRRHTTVEEVRKADVFCSSVPRLLIDSSLRGNGLAW
jgi:hypothetical protein